MNSGRNSGNENLRDRSIYRRRVRADDLVSFQVTVKETDLMILAEEDLHEEAREIVLTQRLRLEEYIAGHAEFMTALIPLAEEETAPSIVRLMCRSSFPAGVGPMASVAGAVAEHVGRELRERSGEIIVENGGDVYLAGERPRVVAIFTAESGLGSRLGLSVAPGGGAMGVCTSSGKFGHSLSLGEASTATVVAPSAALADAAATAVGNRVRGRDGLEKGMDFARSVEGVAGAVIVHQGRVSAWGDLELVSLEG